MSVAETLKRIMGKREALAPLSAEQIIEKLRDARRKRERLAAEGDAAYKVYTALRQAEFEACEDIAQAKAALERLAA